MYKKPDFKDLRHVRLEEVATNKRSVMHFFWTLPTKFDEFESSCYQNVYRNGKIFNIIFYERESGAKICIRYAWLFKASSRRRVEKQTAYIKAALGKLLINLEKRQKQRGCCQCPKTTASFTFFAEYGV